MTSMSVSFLAVLMSGVALCAQGGPAAVPPPILAMRNPCPSLSINLPTIPGTGVAQVYMVEVPGQQKGTYTCALSVLTLGTQAGGFGVTGESDLLTGQYNALTGTFTPDLDAAALNASGFHDFGLTIHSSGLLAVFDRFPPTGNPTYQAMVTSRPTLGSPWQSPVAIQGLPVPGFYDPCLVNVGGQLHLLYSTAGDIVMQPFNAATATVFGNPTPIALKSTAGNTANSPTPIMDSQGELLGLSYHDHPPSAMNKNDHYFAFDLDPNTPGIPWIVSTTWKNNGGYAAGLFFDAEAGSPYHIYEVTTYWWTGGRAPVASAMELNAFIAPNAAALVQSWVFLGTWLPAPVQVPTWVGSVGINPLVSFFMGLHDPLTGRCTSSLSVPPDPQLRGLAIPAQALSFDTVLQQITLGNTAVLTIL